VDSLFLPRSWHHAYLPFSPFETVPAVTTDANATFFLDFSVDEAGDFAQWNVTGTEIQNPSALMLQVRGPLILLCT
jgi:hypothetical protein